MEKKKTVEISGLYKKYSKAQDYAIKDINITCYEGEIVGLLGKTVPVNRRPSNV